MIFNVNWDNFIRVTRKQNAGLIFLKVTKASGKGKFDFYTTSGEFIIHTQKKTETMEETLIFEASWLQKPKLIIIEDIIEKKISLRIAGE